MKDALMQAAKDLLWQDGYARMSPGRVLAASGAGHGSLYHHFAGKPGLAKAAIVDIEAELSAIARSLFDPAMPPLERLHAYLTLDRNGLKGCRLGRLANEADVLNSPELSEPIARYFALVHGLISCALDEAVLNGQLRCSLDAPATASMLLAVIQGGYVIARASQDDQQIDAATGAAWAMLEELRTSVKLPEVSGELKGR
jgi:TetR/AcrR family transcriptional regulator, transcriptional repressor for nem operon